MNSAVATPARRPFRFNTVLLVLFGLFCLISYANQAATVQALSAWHDSPQPTAAQTPTFRNSLCPASVPVGRGECDALVALYQATNGAQWDDHTSWLLFTSPSAPCDWYGVVCNGGHITELQLHSNRLNGTLPHALGQLDYLTRLQLADNLLRGPVPPTLCDLVDTAQVATLSYNQLSTSERRSKECLNRLQFGWINTQTTALREIRATSVTTAALQLTWTPIPYVADGGYYEISYAVGLDSDFVRHGQTADKRADRYLLDNLQPGQSYRIRVQSYTPAHANQENEQRSQFSEFTAATQGDSSEQVLLLVYFAADNDLSPYVTTILQRLERGTRANPNLQVVALTDGAGDHNTTLWEFGNGRTTATNRVAEKWGTDELDTTDPQVLAWFLQSERQRHPAARTVVSLLGHGAGMLPEATTSPIQAAAATPPAIPALPRTVPHTPDDEYDDGSTMSTQDYATALALATDNGANPFDVIFFDQCFQGNLDVLYEMRSAGRVFVASPSYAWLSAPYDRYLAAFTPGATPEGLANAITHIYQESLRDRDLSNDWYPNVIFWVSSSTITTIAEAVNQLATALQAALQAGGEGPILAAATQSQYVDTTTCGQTTSTGTAPDELLGIRSFATNLQQNFSAPDQFGVSAAAGRLLAALTQVHELVRTGHPSIAPEQTWDYSDTLTMIAPLPRTTDGSQRWRSTIFTATAPLSAVWASTTPTSVVTLNSAFASARDGAWDDFLANWYTAAATPTIGDDCNYTPPVQLTSEVTETLTLTLTTSSDLIDFTWSATTNETATNYWLLVRKPDSFGWIVQASLALTQTTYQVQKPPLAGEPYEFTVVAQDESGLIVAQSSAVRYGAVDSANQQLYLPILLR